MNDWFACLDHEQVVERWPRIRELLAPAVEKSGGEMVVDDVLHLSEDGLIHVAISGIGERIVMAVAMNVITYPQQKVLNILALGGTNLRLFTKHLSVLINYAKDIGADSIQAACGDAEARLFLHAIKKHGKTGRKAYSVYRMGV